MNIVNLQIQYLCVLFSGSPYYTHQLCLKVTEKIDHPLIKMLMCSRLLEKMENVVLCTPSLQQVFERLRSREFLKFPENKLVTSEISKVPSEKFTFYNKNNQVTGRNNFSRQQYVQLLKMYSQAIINYYHIDQDMVDCISGKSVVNNVNVAPSENFIEFNLENYLNFDENPPIIDKDEIVQKTKVDKDFKKLVHIRIEKADYFFYRNEVKHILLLGNVLNKFVAEYGGIFSDFLQEKIILR